MARSDNNLKAVLQDTANAIRAKTGASEPIIPRDFADEIENMPTGGGDEVALIERTVSGVYSNAQISVIGSYAFGFCSALTDVSFPNCVSIGSYAFAYCSNLSRAIFPRCSVIGNSPFTGCSNIREMSFDSLEIIPGLMATGCSSVLETISFPNAKIIKANAFSNCKSISEFIFSKCLFIGYGAFSNASIMSKPYSFPEALLICNYAFYSCSFSGYISFPKCLCIGEYALSGNTTIKGLSFPECRIIHGGLIYSLGWGASHHMDQFYFPKLRFITNDMSLFYNGGSFFTGSIIDFPNCFKGNGIASPGSVFISLPKALIVGEYNDEGAGIYCPNVFQINMFSRVRNFSSEIFELKNLAFISGGWVPFDSTNSNIKTMNFPILFSASCGTLLYNLPNLETLNVPNLKDYSYGFPGCPKLSSLALNNIAQLSSNTMQSCSSLESFYMFNASTVAVPLRQVNAFQGTPMSNSSYLGRFGSIYVHPDRVSLYQGATNWATYSSRITAATSEMLNEGIWNWEFVGRSDLTEIPSERINAKNVGDGAFSGCYNLGSVNLSECLFIGASAFVNCSLLSQVNTPKVQFVDSCAFMSNSQIESIDFPSCLYVGYSAFFNCSKLSSVNLPSCVAISNYAFYSCKSLVSIQLENCIYITQYAFVNCQKLSALKAPRCISVYYSAFANCYNLSEVFFPYCVGISSYAFAYCSNLRRIFIPFISRIGSMAFVNCSKLESVYLFNTTSFSMEGGNIFSTTPIGNSTYLGHYGSIYVRASLVEAMKDMLLYDVLKDRVVGLTDEEIASVYQSFGYDVSDF